jgi:hypothetical protein
VKKKDNMQIKLVMGGKVKKRRRMGISRPGGDFVAPGNNRNMWFRPKVSQATAIF